MRRTIVGLFLLAASTPAIAGKNDPFGEDEEDEPVFDEETPAPAPAPAPKPAEPAKAPAKKATPAPAPAPAPAPEDEAEDDEIQLEDETAAPAGEELELEGEGQAQPQAPGADTTAIYRRKLAEVEGMSDDEEVMNWEAYLEQYPNSLFRSTIEQRMDELLASQYKSPRRGPAGPAVAAPDADRAQLAFVQPLNLPNLNPRSRVNVALNIGFGAQTLYTGGQADFEWAFLRNLSVHGGVDGTYTGWGIDAGVRYAFVKSAKHKLVATLMADARMNLSGTPFFQARPVIGLGKILGPAQILASFGADIGTRPNETVALRGGLHVAVRLAPPVALFAESDFYVRNLGHKTLEDKTSPYAFQTVTVGLRFYPKLKGAQTVDPLELAAAGQVGTVGNYVQPYLGAVGLQGTYYLKDREPREKR